MKHLVPILVVVAACAGEPKRTCEDLCDELVGACQNPAYPSRDSCIQGCLYTAEQLGADVASELECIRGAACDLFVIIECDLQYGVDG